MGQIRRLLLALKLNVSKGLAFVKEVDDNKPQFVLIDIMSGAACFS